jgi:hypothetical protein
MERTRRDVTTWRKSTHSGANGGACVEVGTRAEADTCFEAGTRTEAGTAAKLLVRDTTDRDGPVLRVAPRPWHRFLKTLKATYEASPSAG